MYAISIIFPSPRLYDGTSILTELKNSYSAHFTVPSQLILIRILKNKMGQNFHMRTPSASVCEIYGRLRSTSKYICFVMERFAERKHHPYPQYLIAPFPLCLLPTRCCAFEREGQPVRQRSDRIAQWLD